MHTALVSLATLVASVALCAAAPTSQANRGTSFEIQQVATGRLRLKNGPLQMNKTYAKYAHVGAVAPSPVILAAAAAATQTGSVQATPEAYDQEYLCPVKVGSNTLNLDFDTGSSDLWVFSTVTPSSESSGHTLYNPSTSGTLKSGYTWDINYGDGSGAEGIVYADKVVIGKVTATSQAVEAATSVSAEFEESAADGLLGLAFSNINSVEPTAQTTFFDTVKSTLSKAVFTAQLRHETSGLWTFGFINSAAYIGAITYNSVSTNMGFWQFSAGGYAVGSNTTISSNTIGTAIADTGTTLLYLPTDVVEAYYGEVYGASYSSAQGGYVFDCSATLPNLTLAIGGANYVVPGTYLNYAPVSSTQCFGGLQDNTGIGFSIYGDIFLKSVYVVFDERQSTPRIGFAEKASPT